MYNSTSMRRVEEPKLSFPKRFLWGVSTSAHQVEGGTHNDWSVWELENAKVRAKQAEYHLDHLENWDDIKAEAKNPDNYVSGEATDHYNLYDEDFDLIEKMNMNVYRFSIEWSRVEPEQGVWNAEAIDHYKQYVLDLKKRGIEPIVTLFHFSLPLWFYELGGFEKRSNVQYFVRFADKIVRELGMNIRYIVTVNEPETYALEGYYHGYRPPNVRSAFRLWRVVNNLAYAHRQAAKLIHSINRRYKVSIAKKSNYYYPGDDAWLSRLSAGFMQYVQDDYLIKKVIRQCDFLGVNYYHTNRVYGYRVHNPDVRLNDLGWDMQPSDIQYVLERLNRKYKLPIIVTENGLADSKDKDRQWWLTQTLIGMQKSLAHGVKLEGYLHWSLTDNFEWESGKWPKFGLTEIDYKTKKRTLRPSAIWFGRVIKHLRSK